MRPTTIKASATLALLRQTYGAAINIPLAAAAAAIGVAVQTARNQLSTQKNGREGHGRFPLPTYVVNGRRFVHILDLASCIDAQHRGAGEPSRAGRPTKSAQIAKRAGAKRDTKGARRQTGGKSRTLRGGAA